MASSSSLPPAVDVTPAIYDRMMVKVPDEWKDRFRDPLTWDDSMREKVAAVLLPCAVDEAIAQSQQRGDRGVIFYDQKDLETIIYYISEGNTDTVLWMANPDAKQEVKDIVQRYNPETEAAIVMVGGNTVQIMWVREDGKIETSGAKPVNPLPMPLPEEIAVSTEESNGVYAYRFTHSQLGDLGRIRLVPNDETRVEFHTEIASGTTEDETHAIHDLFAPIANTITARLQAALQQR